MLIYVAVYRWYPWLLQECLIIYLYIGDIPDYYKRILAPSGCRQYYMDGKGTIQSFNFDGSAPFPNNLDYTICIRYELWIGLILLQDEREFGIATSRIPKFFIHITIFKLGLLPYLRWVLFKMIMI